MAVSSIIHQFLLTLFEKDTDTFVLGSTILLSSCVKIKFIDLIFMGCFQGSLEYLRRVLQNL